MAFVVRGAKDGSPGYLAIDEAGRVVDIFPDDEAGLHCAITSASRAHQKRRGKLYIPMASNLPSGYAVICVIDYDNDRVYFTVSAPWGLLDIVRDTFDAAYEAAIAAIPQKDIPRRTPPGG